MRRRLDQAQPEACVAQLGRELGRSACNPFEARTPPALDSLRLRGSCTFCMLLREMLLSSAGRLLSGRESRTKYAAACAAAAAVAPPCQDLGGRMGEAQRSLHAMGVPARVVQGAHANMTAGKQARVLGAPLAQKSQRVRQKCTLPQRSRRGAPHARCRTLVPAIKLSTFLPLPQRSILPGGRQSSRAQQTRSPPALLRCAALASGRVKRVRNVQAALFLPPDAVKGSAERGGAPYCRPAEALLRSVSSRREGKFAPARRADHQGQHLQPPLPPPLTVRRSPHLPPARRSKAAP